MDRQATLLLCLVAPAGEDHLHASLAAQQIPIPMHPTRLDGFDASGKGDGQQGLTVPGQGADKIFALDLNRLADGVFHDPTLHRSDLSQVACLALNASEELEVRLQANVSDC
jgi:hypothetical protein